MTLPSARMNATYMEAGGANGHVIVNNVLNLLDISFAFLSVRRSDLSSPPAGPGPSTSENHTIDTSANTITATSYNFATGGFQPGMIVQYDASTGSQNNDGFWTIIDVSGLVLTVEEQLVEDETETAVVTVVVGEPGRAYLVSGTGSGSWTGHDDEIAIYYGGWIFVPPSEGMWIHDENDETRYTWDGTAWTGGDAITDLGQTIAGPTIGEVQDISDKVDVLLGALRDSRIIT